MTIGMTQSIHTGNGYCIDVNFQIFVISLLSLNSKIILPIVDSNINYLLMVILPTISYVEEVSDGVHTHPEDENHESNHSSMEWPSHARLPKKKEKGNLVLIRFEFYVQIFFAGCVRSICS
jgi:hypothetical protein